MKIGGKWHIVSKMAPLFLFLALLIQGSLSHNSIEDIDEHENDNTTRAVLHQPPEHDVLKDLKDINKEWLDIFTLPGNNFYHSPSASMMAQVTQSDKSIEEQLEDIKELANKITLAIQNEMANLFAYALKDCDKYEIDDNSLRKKRSIETPMDSSKLVMRLLRHIKSNNEYQNIAIEKMMTAQEIADKYGIEFNPDPEILTDLAIAANEQAKEMTSILNDVISIKNLTQKVEIVPLENNSNINEASKENDTYYVYSVHIPAEELTAHQNAVPHHEFYPEVVQNVPQNHHHYDAHPQNYYLYPETQIVAPPVHQHYNPVSQMPNFYEPMTFFPSQEYYPQYCPVEPVTTTTTIVLPVDNIVEPEPELVGEEFEETVTSKVLVDHAEPGETTVNHVMTYTVSEKSHFKAPQIEKLPQQMQYYFFLM